MQVSSKSMARLALAPLLVLFVRKDICFHFSTLSNLCTPLLYAVFSWDSHGCFLLAFRQYYPSYSEMILHRGWISAHGTVYSAFTRTWPQNVLLSRRRTPSLSRNPRIWTTGKGEFSCSTTQCPGWFCAAMSVLQFGEELGEGGESESLLGLNARQKLACSTHWQCRRSGISGDLDLRVTIPVVPTTRNIIMFENAYVRTTIPSTVLVITDCFRDAQLIRLSYTLSPFRETNLLSFVFLAALVKHSECLFETSQVSRRGLWGATLDKNKKVHSLTKKLRIVRKI